jgi:hypothetical protein
VCLKEDGLKGWSEAAKVLADGQISRRDLVKWGLLASAGIMAPVSGLVGCGGASTAVSETIKAENAKTGTTEWQLTNPAVNHEIEGYASRTSVNRGEHISLYVSTSDPKFEVEIFRLGWYGGTGGRRLMNKVELEGGIQPVPEPDPTTGLIECKWLKPFDLMIPANQSDSTDWASGVYLAKLTAAVSHKQSYIMFVVRDDIRPSDLLFQSSVNTFQAYNNWGGKSLYDWNSDKGVPARKVSFNRPYAPGPNPLSHIGVGSGEFVTVIQDAVHAPATGWEYVFLRFLEREGYDVTYSTEVDTHTNGPAILNHKALLIVGHSEYWSFEQRANVESARDSGVSLAFFSANSVYWQVRYEPSPVDGSLNRTVVGYKGHAKMEDPLFADPATRQLTTVQWRDPILGRPEDALVGVLYFASPVRGDIVVAESSHWVFAGTGLKNGDRLAGLLGYEVDRTGGHTPSNAVRLTKSPINSSNLAESVVYTAPGGATVFTSGSMFFNLGLDDYGVPYHRPSVLSHPAQQMTRNVLTRLSHAPIFAKGQFMSRELL